MTAGCADILCMRRVAAVDDIMGKLHSFPLFTRMTPSELEVVAGSLRVRRCPKGAFIVSRGEPGTALYLLVSGRVKLTIASPDGKELVLGHLDAPAHFGEASLAERQPHPADVVAITEVEMLIWDVRDLNGALRTQPDLAVPLVAALSRRLRDTIGRLEDLTFHDAGQRVSRVLLNIATAREEATGVPLIKGFTHYDIATLAGTSRETASRVISALGSEGALSVHGRTILVDLERVRDAISS